MREGGICMIIKLTRDSGCPIYINKNVIAYFYKDGESKYTTIQLIPVIQYHEVTDNYFIVKETPIQIHTLIVEGTE